MEAVAEPAVVQRHQPAAAAAAAAAGLPAAAQHPNLQTCFWRFRTKHGLGWAAFYLLSDIVISSKPGYLHHAPGEINYHGDFVIRQSLRFSVSYIMLQYIGVGVYVLYYTQQFDCTELARGASSWRQPGCSDQYWQR